MHGHGGGNVYVGLCGRFAEDFDRRLIILFFFQQKYDYCSKRVPFNNCSPVYIPFEAMNHSHSKQIHVMP